MKSYAFLFSAVVVVSVSSLFAADQSVSIDSDGVTVNGVRVSVTNKGVRVTSLDQMRNALRKPVKVVQTKLGEETAIWDGIALMPDIKNNILSIHLQDFPGEGTWLGSLSIERVPIRADTSVSLVNASLEGRAFKQTSSLPSGGSIWDLNYDNFLVRLSCDSQSRVRTVIVLSTSPLSSKIVGKWKREGVVTQFLSNGTYFSEGSGETDSKVGFDAISQTNRAPRWRVEGDQLIEDTLSPRRTQRGMEFLLVPNGFSGQVVSVDDSRLVIKSSKSGKEFEFTRIAE
jgi:hypothetical protein